MNCSKTGSIPYGRAVCLLVAIILAAGPAYGGERPAPPASRDRCPVCGMFVSKYPDWVSTITYDDGSAVFFDGVKDMLKYYYNISMYHPDKVADSILEMYVTDYYSMEVLPVGEVVFVLDSDVMGPMGKELIPLRGEGEAREFIRDHGGRQISFRDITVDMIP